MDNEMIDRCSNVLRSNLIIEKTFANALIKEIIKAMREPTAEMMVDAEIAYSPLVTFADKEDSPSYIVWRAMIDAIINEK